MKTKNLGLILCLLAGLLMASCTSTAPKVKPLSLDLPASYKSDSVAYSFMKNQVDNWNTFGKKVESLYRKSEKYRKKEFQSLSQRELYNLLQLEYEYMSLWFVQDVYLDQMSLEAEQAMRTASMQGVAKIIETQRVVMNYYSNLALSFGKELNLDQEPYISTPEEDSLYRAKHDSIRQVQIDSIYQKLLPSKFEK